MTLRKIVAVLALIVILVTVNASIYEKEQHLKRGRMVLLELGPVDPRSLMQGDYMALRFAVDRELRSALPKRAGSRGWWNKTVAGDGWAILKLDKRGVGRFVGVATEAGGTEDTVHVAFRVRSGTVKFATNAFFFQEGTAALYEQARFGEFRVNEHGEPLLVALRDEAGEVITPENNSTP